MRYILILLLFSCTEECIKKRNMTISDAIPVQFWITGESTYNETDICGVEVPCFCQPFECDDVINIQITGQSGDEYTLQVVEDNGGTSNTIMTPNGSTWSTALDLTSYCDQQIRLRIITEGLVDFGNRWTNYGSGVSWSTGAFVGISSTCTDSNSLSKELVRPFYWQSGVTYTFTYSLQLTVSGGGYSSTDIFLYEDSATTGVANHFDSDNYSTSGTKNGTFTITPTSTYFGYVRLSQQVSFLGSPASSEVRLISMTVSTSGDYEHAKSDCISVKESHDCSVLINYTNSTDFYGIEYTSPQAEFNLRIPAQFWKENNPMEQEDSELSTGIIKTRRQTIQEKRLLETGFMPNYMHKKVQLALMHDTVTIEGGQWKRRDAYESENGRRYALKRANVWLTLYNSISDNIL